MLKERNAGMDQMGIIHIAFYPSDWLAGTRGLSDSETGVYITLIARMYEMAAPIERDDIRFARLCGCKSKSAFVKALGHLISEGKIIETNNGLFNERVAKEIKIATEKSDKAKAAAQSRWDRKSNKNNAPHNANASPEHMPQRCQSELEPEPYKDTDVSFGAQADPPTKKLPRKINRATQIPDGWVPSDRNIQDAEDRKFSKEEIDHEADQFRDYHLARGSSFKDWNAAWRTWLGNSRTFSAGRKMAGRANRSGHGQGCSIASIVAQRRLGGSV